MSLTRFRRKFRRTIKPILLGFAAIFFLSCFTLYGNNIYSRTKNAGGEYVIAKVNGEEVPRGLYERTSEMALRQVQMMARMPGQPGGGHVTFEQMHQARGRAFESVVDSWLKAQAAEHEGVQVSTGEVRKEIDQQIHDKMTGPEMEGATPDDKRQFEQQLRQLMPEDLTRKRMLVERLEKKLRERFKPTDQEIINSFNEVKVRHILVKTITGRSDADALKKINELRGKATSGTDFATLAKQSTDDTNSKETGGDVGWVSQDTQFVPEFKAAALGLKKGEVSPVVKTMFGYHILKADDVRSKLPKDFNDPKKKEEYRAPVEEKMIRDRTENYYAALRVGAKMEAFDPFIAGYMAENEANAAASNNDTKAYEKKIKEAAAHYEEATQKNQLETGPALWAKLAQMYNASKQDEKAIGAVNKALAYSKSAELYVTLGEIYERQKKKPEAVKAYQEAMGLCYDQPWQYTSLQLKFKGLGRDDLAKKAYAKWTDFVHKDDEQRKRQAQLQELMKKAAPQKSKS
jgi:parvulin-like peptidyl-prolyl isomerase